MPVSGVDGRPAGAGWTGLAGAALFLVAGVFGPVAWSAVELSAGEPAWHVVVIAGVLLPSATVAATLAIRLPTNPVGWLLLTSASGTAVGAVAGHWAEYHPGAAGSVWAAWVSAVLWAFGPPLLPLLALVFPDGHPLGRTGPWGVRAGALGVGLVAVGSAFLPGRLAGHSASPGPRNPLGLPVAWAVPVVAFAVVVLLGGATLIGALTLGRRWREGAGADRLALAAAGTPLVAALGLDVAAHLVGFGGAPVAAAAGVVAAVGVPGGIWLAVTRYRLYRLDLLIAGALGYAVLTVGLAALFWLTAVLSGLAVGRASPLAAASAAAVTATALGPARRRVLAAVQCWLLGPAGDPERAAARVARRLAEVDDPDELPTAAAAAVAEALGLDGVVVLPRDTAADRRLSTMCPLVHHGVDVGILGLTGSTATQSVCWALGRVSRPVAAAMHSAGLSAALRRSRTELVAAVEDERRRLRRDLHDGLGPGLATLAMGLDAVGNRMAGVPAVAGAGPVVARLRAQTDLMLGDLRRIVAGLRPPALDEFGLVGALQLHATDVAGSAGIAVEVVADDLGPLSAAVEVAAYQIAAEAVLNAARHSRGAHCRLTLAGGDGLRLTITDDGRGIAMPGTAGVGTQSMRERAAALGGWVTVAAASPGGTEVQAWLPTRPA